MGGGRRVGGATRGIARHDFSVADLSAAHRRRTGASEYPIDTDAAGHGWFVDPTPADNSNSRMRQRCRHRPVHRSHQPPAGRLDLLTTVGA